MFLRYKVLKFQFQINIILVLIINKYIINIKLL